MISSQFFSCTLIASIQCYLLTDNERNMVFTTYPIYYTIYSLTNHGLNYLHLKHT